MDWDEEDEVTGYGIAGGADGALFAIEAETGELRFQAGAGLRESGGCGERGTPERRGGQRVHCSSSG